MARSLKEALLEQMAALQERGLAPGEIPVEEEEDLSYKHYDEEPSSRSQAVERDREPRRRSNRAPRPRVAATGRGREQREQREPRGRERRPGRDQREGREVPSDLVELPSAAPQRSMAPRPAPIQPGGPRGGFAGPRPAPRADMLRRNAERIQREQVDRSEIRDLLGQYSGGELDEPEVEKFFSQLAVETGALPPLNVVLEALRNAGREDPVEVGNQVRLYYRRSRSRAASTPVAVG